MEATRAGVRPTTQIRLLSSKEVGASSLLCPATHYQKGVCRSPCAEQRAGISPQTQSWPAGPRPSLGTRRQQEHPWPQAGAGCSRESLGSSCRLESGVTTAWTPLLLAAGNRHPSCRSISQCTRSTTRGSGSESASRTQPCAETRAGHSLLVLHQGRKKDHRRGSSQEPGCALGAGSVASVCPGVGRALQCGGPAWLPLREYAILS